ncbi:hypothetical protein JI58_07930 [Marinosulfonomonas sp. PRT-SC04]|nr:hypothetical protein JI58_07930 [Marinosulfonomonas sp. PRT-SC04]
MLVVNATRQRETDSFERARIRNFEMAGLIAIAHHDPKKMPDYKPHGEKPKPVSDEANQARARGAFIALALASGA